MGNPAVKEATYADLLDVPENRVGEIINGELHTMPRPSFRHSNVVSVLVDELGMPYRRGKGGPGGWIILFEPEVQFGKNILVPDLGGWKKERLPNPPETNWCDIPPDWVCKVLSPGSVRIDRIKKLKIYGEYGVPYVWLVDPAARTLEVLKLESEKWLILLTAAEDEKVRAEPFQEIELELQDLWWD